MCEAMQISELARDEKFKTNPKRVENREELINLLQKYFLKKPANYWVDLMEQHQVPAGPINDMKQVFEDEQVVFREMKQSIQHKTAGSV